MPGPAFPAEGPGQIIMNTGIAALMLLAPTIAVTMGIFSWYKRQTLLGVAAACALFSHQVLDAMWGLPSAWFFPLLGPFPVSVIPDYIGRYFWLEISNPSEWVFACASLVIIAEWLFFMPDRPMSFLTPRRITTARYLAAFLLGVMGLHLLFSGLAAFPGAFFAPTYDPVTRVMAGCAALSGTLVLVKWREILRRNP